jgi:hypothetical protein
MVQAVGSDVGPDQPGAPDQSGDGRCAQYSTAVPAIWEAAFCSAILPKSFHAASIPSGHSSAIRRTAGDYPELTFVPQIFERRLFAFITMNWRGKPLVSHQVIVQLIGATTTDTGAGRTAGSAAGSNSGAPWSNWPLSGRAGGTWVVLWAVSGSESGRESWLYFACPTSGFIEHPKRSFTREE